VMVLTEDMFYQLLLTHVTGRTLHIIYMPIFVWEAALQAPTLHVS
jgi:hypothetical protein